PHPAVAGGRVQEHEIGSGPRPLVVVELEAVGQGDRLVLELARGCAHGLPPLLPGFYAQRTSPMTQTASPSGTSGTGAAIPTAATMKMIAAMILDVRPMPMRLLLIDLVKDGDPLDLNEKMGLGEPGHDEERVRRVGRCGKQLVTRGGDQRPIAPVRDVGRGLDQVAQARPVVGEDRREVVVALARLRPGVAEADDRPRAIHRELPRDVKRLARARHVRVVSLRRVHTGRVLELAVHGYARSMANGSGR